MPAPTLLDLRRDRLTFHGEHRRPIGDLATPLIRPPRRSTHPGSTEVAGGDRRPEAPHEPPAWVAPAPSVGPLTGGSAGKAGTTTFEPRRYSPADGIQRRGEHQGSVMGHVDSPDRLRRRCVRTSRPPSREGRQIGAGPRRPHAGPVDQPDRALSAPWPAGHPPAGHGPPPPVHNRRLVTTPRPVDGPFGRPPGIGSLTPGRCSRPDPPRWPSSRGPAGAGITALVGAASTGRSRPGGRTYHPSARTVTSPLPCTSHGRSVGRAQHCRLHGSSTYAAASRLAAP